MDTDEHRYGMHGHSPPRNCCSPFGDWFRFAAITSSSVSICVHLWFLFVERNGYGLDAQ